MKKQTYRRFECLEARRVFHGSDALVTDSYVAVGHDQVPRFAAQADFVAVKDGRWSDPLVWNRQRVPSAGATVQIPHTIDVRYDLNSQVELKAVEVSGRLDFDPSVNTSLWLSELMVMPDGVLTVGTQAKPVQPNVNATIVIADAALDTTGIDPMQWGSGLLVMGTVEMHGQEKSSSYMELAQEPLQGDRVLVLADAPQNWRPGDELVLPDTESNWSSRRIEELVIESVKGNRVTLTNPLQFDHRGARLADGMLRHLPHVGNLSRNVTVKSENPNGVRGHTIYLGRADIDLQYVRFADLGRTLNNRLDNTVIDDQGRVTHIGENQIGRYSMHVHHVFGPENPANVGYQFTIVGNAIDGGERWGLALHGSSYGLIAKNFFYDIVGAGIVTEDGTEAFNVIDGNFAVKFTGQAIFKEGLAGEAFWFRGPLNEVVNNVAANSSRAGFDLFQQNLPDFLSKPLYRGANMRDPYDVAAFEPKRTPWLRFENNEVYASAAALDAWEGLPEQRQYITALQTWHTADNSFTLSSYGNSNVVLDGLEIVGEFESIDASVKSEHQPISSVGVEAIRESSNMVIRNSSIRGVQVGIRTPALQVEKMTIQDSTIQAYRGVVVDRMTAGGMTSKSSDESYGSLTIENTRFLPMPANTASPEQWAIYMNYDTSVQEHTNLLMTNEVFLYDFNGVPGANYRVYFLEQAPNYIVPQSVFYSDPGANFIASPEAGLTNQQLWAKYEVALAGAVAPTRQIDGDNGEAALARGKALGIRGLVFPLEDSSPAPRANAGADRQVQQYKSLGLAGNVSRGGVADWSKLSGPGEVSFQDFRAPATEARFTEAGTYVLRLTTSVDGRQAFDDVVVTVTPSKTPLNRAPKVNAGSDLTLETTNKVKLDGMVSDDGRGGNKLASTWKLISGPGTAEFANPKDPTTEVVFSNKGEYLLELRGDDGELEVADRVTITVNAVIPKAPLLGHWTFDSILGDAVPDRSLHGLTATLKGAVKTLPGKSGTAISLQGGYITMPISELLSPSDGMTVALSVKPSRSDVGQLIFNWEGGSWDAYAMSVTNRNDRAYLDVVVTTTSGVSRFSIVTAPFSAVAWTHVALTFSDANGGSVKVYRDGELIGRRTGVGSQLSYMPFGTKQLSFGKSSAISKGPTFIGAMDDIRIYNYELSQLQLMGLIGGVAPLHGLKIAGRIEDSLPIESSTQARATLQEQTPLSPQIRRKAFDPALASLSSSAIGLEIELEDRLDPEFDQAADSFFADFEQEDLVGVR